MTAEKNPHPLKNTGMSLPDTLIVLLGRPFRGHNHAYTLLKQEVPPAVEWFAELKVRGALGDLGMKSADRGAQIDIPTQKPRKSHKNPNPHLRDEPSAAHTALSRVRILIEHAIGGMKRYNILVHTFRNRIEHFEDDVIGVWAGLWNLVLSY